MHIERVRLRNFRNHCDTEVRLDPQLTLVIGPNGHGKTNLLEAIDLLSGRRSFRGAQISDLITVPRLAPAELPSPTVEVPDLTAELASPSAELPGPPTELPNQPAQVLAAVTHAPSEKNAMAGRRFEVELRFAAGETTKAFVNKNAVTRLGDLGEVVQTVVFSPADLELVQGSPAQRRQLLDDIAGAVSSEYRRRRHDLDRVLRQRNALLKQSRHNFDADAQRTLDVWDSQLVDIAAVVGAQRAETVAQLLPFARRYYAQLAASPPVAQPPGQPTGPPTGPPATQPAGLALQYRAPWRADGLAQALAQSRPEDLRRGTTTTGPHRDDVVITLNSLPAGTHCSQGEQRCTALALRLAQHQLLTEALADTPVVLLDDVFSELDTQRAQNLIGCLPPCQVVVTSATGTLPVNASVGKRIELLHGQVLNQPPAECE